MMRNSISLARVSHPRAAPLRSPSFGPHSLHLLTGWPSAAVTGSGPAANDPVVDVPEWSRSLVVRCSLSLFIALLGHGCTEPIAEPNSQEQSTQIAEERYRALRPPTKMEADRIAAACGIAVEPYRGMGRPAPWAAYQPVDATPSQESCYYDQIRQLLARPI